MGFDNKPENNQDISLSNWCGYDWHISSVSPDLRVLSVQQEVKEEGYSKSAYKLTKYYQQAAAVVRKIFPNSSPFRLEMAVFPATDFRDHVSLPQSVPLTVTGRVLDGRICENHIAVQEYSDNLFDIPADKQVGKIHEICHPVLNEITSRDIPLTFNEGLAEVIPRFFLGLEIKDKTHRDVISQINPDKLVDPIDLDASGNLYLFGPDKIGYNSALLFTLGAILGLDTDFESGFYRLIDILKETPGQDLYSVLAQKTNLPLDTPEGRRSLQLQAIGYVRDHYSVPA